MLTRQVCVCRRSRTGSALLEAGCITLDPAVVLANAIYFWAVSADPFDPADTRDAPFTLADGSQITVPMMSAEVEARGAVRDPTGSTPSVLEVDYQDREVSFVVVLPTTPDGLAETTWRGRMNTATR